MKQLLTTIILSFSLYTVAQADTCTKYDPILMITDKPMSKEIIKSMDSIGYFLYDIDRDDSFYGLEFTYVFHHEIELDRIQVLIKKGLD